MRVIRPCDAQEAMDAWLLALTHKGPTSLVLTRQNLKQYAATQGQVDKGGYVLSAANKAQPDLILMGSGSEMSLLTDAQEVLRAQGIEASVVSMPSMEIFLKQSKDYQEQVLPMAVRKRLAVEAGASQPWYRFTGLDGKVLGIDRFGASAPAETIFMEYGFTVDNVVKLAQSL